MKLVVILTLVAVLQATAGTYAQRITLKAQNIPLSKVMDEVHTQTGYDVFFSGKKEARTKVNVDLKNASMEESMMNILRGLPLQWTIKDKTIIIRSIPDHTPEVISPIPIVQDREIRGKVVDVSGNPLEGVTVTVKGATVATSTNNEGNYRIMVPEQGGALVFTIVGFKPEEVVLDHSSVVNVTLSESISDLDEVVIIGYEAVKRRDLTAAISTIGGNDLRDVTVNSSEQALTGRLAGVQVTTSEGALDADVNIVVRGGGSITQDNSPLYIVDGVQVEDGLRSVSPQDIERIDVLKDASATAIYGSRGANGVVLVTTKSGKTAAATVNYNGFVGVNQLPRTLDVMNPYEFVLYQYERNIIGTEANMQTFNNMYGVSSFSDIEKYRSYTPVDWQRQVMGNDAWTQTHYVSLNGGTNDTKYNISFTHNNTDGVVINTDYLRNLLNVKLDQTISSKFTAGVTFRYSNTNSSGAGTSDPGNAQLNGIRNFVKYKPYLDAGVQVDEFDEEYFNDTNQGGGLGLMNPIAWSLSRYRNRDNEQTNIGAYLNYTISDLWSFRSTGGFNRNQFEIQQFNDVLRSVGFPSATINSLSDRTFNLSNVLTYSNTNSASRFAEKNALTVLLGQEIFISEGEDMYTELINYPRGISAETALLQLTQGELRPGFPNRDYDKSTLLSFFGRANYTFDERYLLSLTLRADGSSKFAADNRWGYFPSGSLAWRISRESFMENLDWFQDLKLRLTYGTSGNNRMADYLFLPSFTASSLYGLNNSLTSYGYQPDYLANPNLKWETTVVQNLGLDFSILKNRLQVSVDLYNNRTIDVITSVPVSPVVGYASQLQNTANTRNRGLEVQLSALVLKSNKFSWNADFNISFNKNVIRSLASGLDYYIQSSGWVSLGVPGDYIVKVGEAVGSMWGYVTDGFYTVDDFNYDPETSRYTLKEGVPTTTGVYTIPQPGSIKIKDFSGDGRIGEDDKQIIGVGVPKGFGGLNQQFTYGNFDASIFVNFQFGNDVLNANKMEFANGYLSNNNLSKEMEGRWKTVDAEGNVLNRISGANVIGVAPEILREANRDATIWQPIRSTPGYYITSWAVEDGSFIRINNITVGYSLESSWLKRIKFKRLRVYATTNNIALFTRYSGYDPEVNTRRSTGVTPGVDYSAYPRTRNFIFGVNLSL